MSARERICGKCGGGYVLAAAPKGGYVPLRTYPDDDGRYRVVVRTGRLVIVDRPTGEPVKRWNPHAPDCKRRPVRRRNAVTQLDLLAPPETP